MRNFGFADRYSNTAGNRDRLALNPLLVGGLEQALKSAEGTKLPKCGARVPAGKDADWRPRTSAILLKPIMLKKRIQSGFVAAGLLLGPFCRVGVSQDEVVQSAAIKILQAKCETCHGSSQISGLDLRKRESVLKGGVAGTRTGSRKRRREPALSGGRSRRRAEDAAWESGTLARRAARNP